MPNETSQTPASLGGSADVLDPRRNWKQAIGRGVRGMCPSCGEGRLFACFLKPVEHCADCGEDLSHQRADDFPPYIVILLLGHLLAPIMIELERTVRPPLWAYMVLGPVVAVVLGLLLIQPAKGGVIALQWAQRMHGFGAGDRTHASHPPASDITAADAAGREDGRESLIG